MANTHMQTVENMRKDPALLNAEYQRAQQTIAERQKQNQDTTAQQNYLNTINQINTANHGGRGLNATNTYQDQVNGIYDKQREAQLAALRAQQQRAVSQLSQQKAQVAPQYQGLRNQADVVNLQNVKRMKESMAANGLNQSGENVTAQIGLNAQRQNSLNALNLQEQETINDLERRILEATNPAQEQALIAQLEAERSKALYQAYTQAQQFDYQKERDGISDQRWQDQWNYQQQRDQVGDDRWQSQWDYQQQRDKVGDEWREKQWNELSPAEKQRAQMDYDYYKKQQALANSYKRSSGGGGGSGSSGSSSSSAQVNPSLGGTGKPMSASDSFNYGITYWSNVINEMKQKGGFQGAVKLEQEILKSPDAIREITNSGYDLDKFIDALYYSSTNGQFKDKSAYEKYLDDLDKKIENRDKW